MKQPNLNAICPYFTMFPLDFPLRILQEHSHPGDQVLDPFCGRGTTNMAARLLELETVGMDSSPVAVAITHAKMVSPTVEDILKEAKRIIDTVKPSDIPSGPFWELAYHPETLYKLCQFREAFLKSCRSNARIALRGILLGALHGPRGKKTQTYFSNQMPRTFAPKPDYSIRYWSNRGLEPPRVNVLEVIERRARCYDSSLPQKRSAVLIADSREGVVFHRLAKDWRIRWVITSPPYFGMRTYIPDQWLRYWFLGGESQVVYSQKHQIEHVSEERFTADLKSVWINAAHVCIEGARLIVRFGAIPSRRSDPLALLERSFTGTDWRIERVENSGTPPPHRRLRGTFYRGDWQSAPIQELDVWARLGRVR